MSDYAIEASGITKRYGSFVAVDRISLRVPAGTIFGFLGPNGAGKTTVIKILLGLITPDAAAVAIFGKDLFTRRNEIVRSVGAIVEAPVFFEYMSARENLHYLTRVSGSVTRLQIQDTLRTVGLEAVADKTVRTFSYGMKQRLGIAQALLPDNRLIFLDEPTNGLDPHGIMGIRRLLRQLRDERGITIFLSSHLLSEVEQVCDHVNIINHGATLREAVVADLGKGHERLEVQVAEADRVKATDALRREGFELATDEPLADTTRLLLFRGGGEHLPAMARALVAAGVDILRLGKNHKTLEDIFVELTQDHVSDHGADRFRV